MSAPAHTDLQAALVAELRSNASAGYDEWRVQDPKDGSYCIAYSWPDTIHPELEARDWLADHRTRFPHGRYVDYVVTCVRVVPKKDRLLAQAADSLEQGLAALDAEHAQRIALQHHAADQAQRVADLEAEIERLRGLLSREQKARHAALAEVDRITEAGRVHTRRAAAFEAQRDELVEALQDMLFFDNGKPEYDHARGVIARAVKGGAA